MALDASLFWQTLVLGTSNFHEGTITILDRNTLTACVNRKRANNLADKFVSGDKNYFNLLSEYVTVNDLQLKGKKNIRTSRFIPSSCDKAVYVCAQPDDFVWCDMHVKANQPTAFTFT